MALWSCLLTGQQVHFVSSAADDGEGTLRSILQLANPFDTIRFQPGLDTVFLTSGELTINKSVYLEGNENVTFIKRDGSSPLFRLVRITSTDTLRVSFVRMGFTGGSALTGTEATVNGEGGGAVMAGDSVHDLSFEWCEFINNMSGDGVSDGWNGEEYFAGKGGHGGAIYTNSKGRLKDCLLKKNFCGTGGQCHKIVWNWYDLIGEDGGDGGAIYATANLVMENCRLDSNRAGNGRSAIGYGSDYVGAYAGKGGDGGGLVCTGDSLVITACEFTCNIAGSSGHAQSNQTASSKHGGNGGAVVGSGSAMAISNSVFTGNRAGNGGSVLSGGDQASGSDGGDGGALYGMGSVMVVAGSEFSSNMSGNGGNGSENYGGDGGNGGSGGGICAVSSEARFTGCWIENNKAGNGGNGPGGMGSSLKMNGGSGGGICISSATNDCYLVSCMVKSNISGDGGAHLAMRPGASGGHGGGMAYFEPSGLFTCHLVNCDVSFNAAGFARVPVKTYYELVYPRGGSGGGIYCPEGKVSLVNVTCAGNQAGSAYFSEILPGDTAIIYGAIRGFGGGICDTTGTSELMNSLFAFNKAYPDSLPADNDLEGIFNLNYSLVEENNGFTFSGNNNILGVDPLFFDFPASLLLEEASPAIDAGNPDTSFLYLPAVDLAGNPRIINGRIDPGAYEYSPGYGFDDESLPGSSGSGHPIVTCSPNPFRGETCLEYELPADAMVDLAIFNDLGQCVQRICNVFQCEGKHKLTWNANGCIPGIYLYRLGIIPVSGNHLVKYATGKIILER